MPTLERGARTRTVETRTTEEIPVGEGGLGCSPIEYLLTCSEEDLAISSAKVYRYDAGSPGKFLVKFEPAQRIDEDYIGTRFGGGTYGVRVYCKNGKSGFDRNVAVDQLVYGPPKVQTSANEPPPAAAPAPPPANDAVMNRLIDAMERQSDRIERLFEQRNAPPAPSQSDAAQSSVVSVMAEASKAAIGVVAEAAKAAITAGPAREAAKENSFDQDLQRLKILKEIAAPAATAAQPDMMGQVTQFVTLFKALDDFRGGGARGDWKDTLVEKGIERIPDLVDLGKSILAGRGKEAEELRKREEARAKSLENIRVLQSRQAAPGAPIPAPSPAAGPAPAAPGESFSPLRVVPIDFQPGASPAPPPVAAEPAAPEPIQPEVIPPGEGGQNNAQENAAMLQEWFKRRVVQLVAEGDEPAAVLDFIDRVDPVVGAIITKSSEKQIRAFLAADPILAEITRLPNYEAFLSGLLDELRGDDEQGEAPSGSPPALKVN